MAGVADVAEHMEDLGEHLDEYGYVTVSTPLLSRPDGRFTFGLDRSAQEYFDEAKAEIQGEAASFEQRTFTLAVEAAMAMSPEAKADAAARRARCATLRAQADERMDARRQAVEDQYKADRLKAAAEADATKRAELEAAASQRRADGLKNAVEVDPCPPAQDATTPDAAPNSRPPVDYDGDTKPDAGPPEFVGTGEFQPFKKLLEGGPTPTLSNRSAIIQSAGDRAVQAIFNVLGDPGAAQRFADRITLLGVSTVTVAPGWRTRQGFAADVAVAVELSYTKARPEIVEEVIAGFCDQLPLAAALAGNHGLSTSEVLDAMEGCIVNRADERLRSGAAASDAGKTPEEKWTKALEAERKAFARLLSDSPNATWTDLAVPAQYNPPQALDENHVPIDRPVPVVTSVSPMTESQNLDLASSFRSRRSIALGLNFILRSAGMNQSADAFAGYVKQMEVDVATRTPDVVVSSFGGSHLFGYQVGPQLKAIGDAASRKPKPRVELGRQTFPALVICGFSREDLRPVIGCEPLTGEPPAPRDVEEDPTQENGRLPHADASGRESLVRTANMEGDEGSWDSSRVFVFEPQLRFTQVPRWVPLDKKRSRDAVEEDDLLAIASKLDQSQPRTPSLTTDNDRAASLADMRIEEMWARAFGSTAAITLPLEMIHDPSDAKSASIDFIQPDRVSIAQGRTFAATVVGKGLRSLCRVEDLNDIVSTNLLGGSDPTTRAVEVTAKHDGTALLQFYELDTRSMQCTSRVAAFTLNLTIPKTPPSPPAPSIDVATIRLQRDGAQVLQGVTVQVKDGLEEKALAEAMRLLATAIQQEAPKPPKSP